MKKFGQHFLINNYICEDICDLTKIEGNNILEIGPGRGQLTQEILQAKPKKLFAIEIDNKLDKYLQAIKLMNNNFDYILGDAKQYLLQTISEKYFNGESFRIIANLPYNIGTRLLVSWYKDLHLICDELVLMLQEEVVDRICSNPNKKSYGRLSVLSQYVMNTQKCFIVGPGEFHKPPKVNSAVFKGVVKQIDLKRYDKLYEIVSLAFQNRRKVLKHRLQKYINIEVGRQINGDNFDNNDESEEAEERGVERICRKEIGSESGQIRKVKMQKKQMAKLKIEQKNTEKNTEKNEAIEGVISCNKNLNQFLKIILRKRAEDLSLEDYLRIVDLNL